MAQIKEFLKFLRKNIMADKMIESRKMMVKSYELKHSK
jgi:hypothetical protein